MNATLRLALAALALALGPGTAPLASAQGVWRCGPEGREYTDQPCPASGRAVDAADPRSAEQRLQAREMVDRERRLGEALARERALRDAPAALAAPVARTSAPTPPRRDAATVSREPRTARAPAPPRSAAGTSRAAARESRRAAD